MGKFDGKVFLELGTNVASVDIVKYAKSEGAYVIVTDYLPTEKSEAKKYADETAMISTLDVEAIYEFAKEKHIDGIFCGVSEAALEVVCEVAERLNLPCYLSKKYFRLNRDKLYFKDMCKKYGINVPTLFSVDKDNIDEISQQLNYPVVVKPNDQSAGNGVAICVSPNELKDAFDFARKVSGTDKAFVEEYICGDEVSFVYTIKNGKATLSYAKDRMISKDHEYITSLCDIAVSPSKYLRSYCESQNDNVVHFLETELFKNGTVFLQGIYKNGKVYFLEMGCRMSGGADYRLIEKENGINFMKMLVDISILGDSDGFNQTLDNPFFMSCTCKLNIFAHAGQIGQIGNIEEIRQIEGVIFADYRRRVGDIIVEDGSLKQEVFECHLVKQTREELCELILDIQSRIAVKDTLGNNMLFVPFDVNRLLV